MKFVINGTEYDLDSINRLTLWDTIELEKQCGITLDGLSARAAAMQDNGAVDTEIVGIMVWLSRRKAGEPLTLAQACDFMLSDFQMVPDEGDPEPEPLDPPTA